MCRQPHAPQVRQSPQKRSMHDIEYRALRYPVDPSQSPSQEWRLGVRRVTSLAPSAFLASAAGTRTRPPGQDSGEGSSSERLRRRPGPGMLDVQTQSVSPEGPDAAIQRVWDRPSIDADITMLEISMPERHHRARLLVLSAPHSGDWLHALPLSACGLRMDDETVR